jgi:hypothetical protein
VRIGDWHGSGLVLLAACLAVAPGCREELGPERFPTATVAGVVVKSGQPVTGGWVEFQPADGAVGDFRSARIGRDGGFRTDGVAIGLNVVRLVDLPDMPPGAAALLGNNSPIRRKIEAEASGTLRIDVIDELLRYQNAQPARARTAPREGETRP